MPDNTGHNWVGIIMRLSKTSFAAGAICALVLGSSGAYAATGVKFILGKSNSAGATTTLSSSRGPALSLKASGPALKVSNSSKIANLNADSVDGLSSSAFARSNGKFGAYDVPGFKVDSDNNGLTDTIVATAQCPPGTQRTGGGGYEATASGLMFLNAPDEDNSWIVAVLVDEGTFENANDVIASIICYNPTGSVPGSYRLASKPSSIADLPADTRTRVLTKAQHLAKQ